MKFNEMTYTRPDIGALLARCRELAAKAAAAPDGDALVRLYYEQSEAFAEYNTAANLANIHYTCDTRNAYWKAEQDFFDANGPAVTNASVEISRAFLANPHVDALTAKFGTTCVAGMKNAVLGMDDRTVELQQQFNALVSRYQQIYGGALVELDGKQLTIPQLGPYKEDLDPAVRRAAYEAEAGYFDAHRAELDELYGEIVKNLNAQARVMGYHDYSELSYVRMNRIGYGPEEIRKFRDQVANDVVPQLQKVMALRAKRTGIARPTFTDLPIMFKDGNPKPIPGYKARMDAARTMYHELSPETAEFIDFMQDNELFDVESRPGKMSGGYMTSLPSYKAPFIFANWNNTSGDVDVLTHECGHAFEGYVAERDPAIPADLECPGMESAEIHSMAMEFLTAPWHHLLFGKDTDKYALLHAEDSFVFLAYGCEVDEFQHIMYQNPDLTPDERNAEWLKLEKKYRPWIDFAGLPFYGRGAGWQRQLHIYECPFYYIDYCLSTMAALQFFLLSLTDHKDAWERYLRLVRRAGMASYTELLETAGLKVPFEEGSIKGIAQQMTDWLENHQV
ncbi:M3 family oligoendopeptidase [Faecalibacterium langellae]|uniref:M3 family oligoendopeptidase n=1 Tax=Faecalibacterium langellae TaxID=3435293 RepID=A0A2A6ZAL1_9FIRM|nr:M3 family oligoendopeptidase [Faecalibacterium prausnitzii]PDX58419.1 M3 family oligoendopeptidase [Faecalibacterium prausnitzii]